MGKLSIVGFGPGNISGMTIEAKNTIEEADLIVGFSTYVNLVKENFTIENNPENAEIIVINTCGFIESAKEEAINTILEMAEYKKNKCKYLIVMGCLVDYERR